VKNLLNFPDVDQEEKRRRVLLSVFLLCGIIFLLLFALFHFLNSNFPTLLINILTSIIFSVCLVRLQNTNNSKLIFRFATTTFIILLLYLLMSEGEDGSAILWMYSFPIVIFLLVGKIEGLFWLTILFSVAIAILYFHPPHTFHYQIGTKMRFPLSFLLVSLFSYYIEAIRLSTHITLMEEVKQSQKYLDEIKTLQGILPICSHCKKIRNDEGIWNQLESYITQHSGAEFTHSVCPVCIKELYPDLADDILNTQNES
jgi:hypothetical protein